MHPCGLGGCKRSKLDVKKLPDRIENFFYLQMWPPAALQPLELQRCKVPQLKVLIHTDWFQEFFSNNSLFWRYSLELSNLRFVWPYISLKNPRNFKKAHGKFSEPFYIENTKFHFNIMTEIFTFFGPDFLSHWIPLNFCLKYLYNWQLMYAKAKVLA